MPNILSPDDFGSVKSISLTVSGHARDDRNVTFNAVSGSVVIGRGGVIFSNSSQVSESVSITLIGGVDTFVNGSDSNEFYITYDQQHILYQIVSKIAKNYRDVNINGNPEELVDLAKTFAIREA